MELIKKIIEEIELRKHGKRGTLENLSDLELYEIASKLKIKIHGNNSAKFADKTCI